MTISTTLFLPGRSPMANRRRMFICTPAAMLHVQPQECYAVEDSPNGIHSAYSAGCKVFMVPDLTQPDAELEKFIYKKVESLVALKEYF